MKCPCGSGVGYPECCAPFHRGGEPSTATELMRSRYAAFVLGDADYLLRTLHPDHDDRALDEATLRKRLEAHFRAAKYRGLVVLDADRDRDGTERVLFHVAMTVAGKDASFVELSSFVHDGTGIRYIGGVIHGPRSPGALSGLRIADFD